jgi:tetratricopeptide (TPR) repeat protein
MSDRDPEARIRDLRKRMEREPGSRSFVSLAEEYRRAGRMSDALKSLEEGLLNHPSYVAARVALARTYLEVGRTQESMEAFSQALADDPSNLVASKALGDLYLSRGEKVEALKRYLRYRGISGDRRLDDVIAKLQSEVQPPPPPAPRAPAVPLPPPPTFRTTPLETRRPALPDVLVKPYSGGPKAEPPASRPTDPGDISGITFERPAVTSPAEEQPAVPSRDQSLDALHVPRDDDEIVTRKIRLPEATWPFQPQTAPTPEPAAPPPATAEPQGRALADLYFEQGHFAEARSAYDFLLAAAPSDEGLLRSRDEAARRAAAPPVVPAGGDRARERRLAKVEVLNQWLSTVRRSAGPEADKLLE